MGQRKTYISVLNVIACLAVVMLHANGVFWEFSYDRYWISANVIESLFYFAVPVFFMISGVTLLDYRQRYGTEVYVKKRIQKALIPFLFWNCVAVVYLLVTDKLQLQELSFISFINAVINSEYVSVYWFFIALFTVYLSIPFFGLITEKKRKKIYMYIIVLTFVLNSLLPFLCAFVNINYNYDLVMPLGSNYLIYVLLGYCIDQYEIKRKCRILIYILGFAGLIMQCLGTWYLSYEAGQIIQTFKGYINVPCILYSVAVFILFRYQDYADSSIRILDKISGDTFGIYLIHWFILDYIVSFSEISRYSIWYRVGGGILVFVVSGLLVKILRHIPQLRKVLP